MNRFLIPLVLLINALTQNNLYAQDESIGTTKYYEVYSNFWLNLHHYLYQKATGNQARHLEEDGLFLLDWNEEKILSSLSEPERIKLQYAIQYYKDSICNKSLLRGLGNLRLSLQNQLGFQAKEDSSLGYFLAQSLNSIAPIYRQHIWPVHHAQNQKVWKQHEKMIKDYEPELIPRLEELAGYSWPNKKVRIDLCAYANWAGAYTPNYPSINLFISTLDPKVLSFDFIETVFHESTHILFSRNSDFRSSIFFKSKDLEIKFDNRLWHACQFYLVGRLVKERLAKDGIEYSMLMKSKNIFSSYNTPEFRSILDSYFEGVSTLDTTVTSLLERNR